MAERDRADRGAHDIYPREAPPGWLRAAAWTVRRLPAGRHRAMDHFREGRFAARLPAETGGAGYVCDLRDGISREVFFTGGHGPRETAVLGAVLRPGATFVDVGAHWGYFTLLAAHLVGPAGRVVAMEPHPRLFTLLRANVEANRLRQVSALAIAAADGDGTLELSGHDPAAGNWGLSSLVADGGGTERFSVDARTVDGVLDEEGAERVDLLKMDVGGAGEAAPRGMEAGLARGRHRRVLVKPHSRGGAPADDVGALFRAAGYRGWMVDPSPEAARRASHGRGVDARSLLRPLDAPMPPRGEAPHQLWIAPGEEPR